MSNTVHIEYIQNYFQVKWLRELIVIFNGSDTKFDLKGWRVVCRNLENGKHIFTHNFYQLRRGSFDPAERLFLISGTGTGHFHHDDNRWDFYTNHKLLVMHYPKVEVQLFNNDKILDIVRVVRERVDIASLKKGIGERKMAPDKTINFNIGGNVGVLSTESPESNIQNTMNILTDHKLLDKVLEELRTIRGSADQQNSKELAIIDGVLAEAPTNPQALERIKSISGWLVDHVDKVGTTLIAALLKGQLGI